jgi:hypothetical protein
MFGTLSRRGVSSFMLVSDVYLNINISIRRILKSHKYLQ